MTGQSVEQQALFALLLLWWDDLHSFEAIRTGAVLLRGGDHNTRLRCQPRHARGLQEVYPCFSHTLRKGQYDKLLCAAYRVQLK